MQDLLFLFTLKVLVHGMLHRVNAFFEATVPVILHSVVSTTHQLLGDETPLFGALVS